MSHSMGLYGSQKSTTSVALALLDRLVQECACSVQGGAIGAGEGQSALRQEARVPQSVLRAGGGRDEDVAAEKD